jgi:1-acyl-sn-glycerol-3-phosphate acyltransferase
MMSTSDVAPARTSPATVSGPAAPPGRLSHWWRVLRTGLAFASFGAGAIVVAALAVPLRLLPYRTAARREAHLQRVIHRAVRLFIWFSQSLGLIRVSWIDAERLRESRPQLIVANHPSLLDVILLLARLPQADCIVKQATRKNAFLRAVVMNAGYLPNDGGGVLIDACADRISAGRHVVLFPEGTRSPEHGLRSFQRGAAHIALKTGCGIVPVIITCQPPTLLKGQAWYEVPRRRIEFVVRVAEPIDPARYMDAETTLPIAARRLTADLQLFYQRRLDADEVAS